MDTTPEDPALELGRIVAACVDNLIRDQSERDYGNAQQWSHNLNETAETAAAIIRPYLQSKHKATSYHHCNEPEHDALCKLLSEIVTIDENLKLDLLVGGYERIAALFAQPASPNVRAAMEQAGVVLELGSQQTITVGSREEPSGYAQECVEALATLRPVLDAAPQQGPSDTAMLEHLLRNAYEHKNCDAPEDVYISIKRGTTVEKARSAIAAAMSALKEES